MTVFTKTWHWPHLDRHHIIHIPTYISASKYLNVILFLSDITSNYVLLTPLRITFDFIALF